MSSSTTPKVGGTVSPYLHPLDEFYAHAGLELPSVQVVPGAEVPEPQKTLLVHESDMTPTLERFYKQRLHLRLLNREERTDFYYRQVLLVTENEEKPVEFGAIKINLHLFTPAAQRAIRGEHAPLGTILADEEIVHTSRPKAYLKIRSDAYIQKALSLTSPHVLYGRRNTLSDPQGRALAEIVEILPP
jgi:chorismate-pyruvate lyase